MDCQDPSVFKEQNSSRMKKFLEWSLEQIPTRSSGHSQNLLCLIHLLGRASDADSVLNSSNKSLSPGANLGVKLETTQNSFLLPLKMPYWLLIKLYLLRNELRLINSPYLLILLHGSGIQNPREYFERSTIPQGDYWQCWRSKLWIFSSFYSSEVEIP